MTNLAAIKVLAKSGGGPPLFEAAQVNVSGRTFTEARGDQTALPGLFILFIAVVLSSSTKVVVAVITATAVLAVAPGRIVFLAFKADPTTTLIHIIVMNIIENTAAIVDDVVVVVVVDEDGSCRKRARTVTRRGLRHRVHVQNNLSITSFSITSSCRPWAYRLEGVDVVTMV